LNYEEGKTLRCGTQEVGVDEPVKAVFKKRNIEVDQKTEVEPCEF
jgi:hypothetical protein